MATAEKSAVIAEMTENFRKSTATVMTEYRGLSVTQLKELRRALGPTTTYKVVKNTLSRLAAKAAGVELKPTSSGDLYRTYDSQKAGFLSRYSLENTGTGSTKSPSHPGRRPTPIGWR